jgi:hypothetical protein
MTVSEKEKLGPDLKSDFNEERPPRDQKLMGKLATMSSFNATSVMANYPTSAMESLGGADFREHWPAVKGAVLKVLDGDMKHPEAMLISQAMTLESIFNRFAEMAAAQLGASQTQRAEIMMRMALKAQAQCTQTLRVLGELKSPKQVAFIKQQNNAAGHQQVNNGASPEPSASRVHEETDHQSNELLEHQNGERLEFGTASEAGRSDQAMETVGAIHRPDDDRG